MTEFKLHQIYRKDGKPVTVPAAMLADGQQFRVGVMMRDGACPDCGGSGLYPSSVRCPSCGGTGVDPASTTSDRSSLSEADRRVLADAEMRARAVGHRPGFYVDTSAEGKAARQKTFDAMAEADEIRENAWRNLASNIAPPTVATDTNTGDVRPAQADGRTTDQIAQAHRENMERIYRDYETAAQNAHKNLR